MICGAPVKKIITRDDDMIITVLPFEYNRSEWARHPAEWLDYILRHKKSENPNIRLSYNIIYSNDGLLYNEGYLATLIIDNRVFELPLSYMTTNVAKANVIILALLNIVGYCESVNDLIDKIISYLLSNRNFSFATRPVSIANSKSV